MNKGELTLAIEHYRFIRLGMAFFTPTALWNNNYSHKRIDQMFNRARRSIGYIKQSRYHKGWAKQKYG